jgi:hypothetical protein
MPTCIVQWSKRMFYHQSQLKTQNNEPHMMIWHGFKRGLAPSTGRETIQLTAGDATCYPLYYFIPTFTSDGRYLVHHRAEKGEVQIHALDLASGTSVQLTHASAPKTRWIPWCIESGRGVLDHLSVLDTYRNRLIYFDDRDVRSVDLAGSNDHLLFSLPGDRMAMGQNCISPDGEWFVYIHHDRDLFAKIHQAVRRLGDRHLSQGTVLAAYNLNTGEHRNLVIVNSPIHHVLPHGTNSLIFCHPATENGMLLTNLDGGSYTHLRTQDDQGGCVCHYVSTRRGIAYEVLERRDKRVLAGRYNPETHQRYEFTLPSAFGYTHTGRDPEGLLWFFENQHPDIHDLHFLVRHDPAGQDEWLPLTGHWPTYGAGQKSHFHPQICPDRNWLLMTGGDPVTQTNHIYLVDIADLNPTEGIPSVI